MLPRSLALLLAVVLLAAGALRIGSFVAQQPVLGYANQFDMGRTSACLALWPALAEPARYEAHREAPVGRYVDGEHRPDECYVSSELIFSGFAVAAWKLAAAAGWADAGSMDLRFVGVVKGVALIFLALIFTWLLREWPARALTHAAIFAIVLADPVVTLWLNTLYTEFSALLFLYAAIVALAVIIVETPERPGWYLTFGASLLGLGLSRQQHLLLPVLLFVLALPAMWRHYRRALWPLASIPLVVIALQLAVIARPASITSANNVNVVLGTLLPATSRQALSLDRLGLPTPCEGVIGATWYVSMGEELSTRCPEVFKLPRSRILSLVLADPAIVGVAFLKAAPLAQPAVLRYVGIEENRAFGTLDQQHRVFAYSIGTLIEKLPPELFLGMLLLVMIAFPVSLLAWARTTVRNGTPSLESALGAALSGTVVYAFASSLLGDGTVEIPRHVHLGTVAMHTMIVLVMALALTRIASLAPQRAGSRPASVAIAASPWYEGSLLSIATIIAVTSPLWVAAWRQQPLAVGVVDEPERNRHSTPIVRLHGWAMDPFGPVKAVTVIDGKTRVESRPWQHPADPTGIALARVFPTYHDPGTARFEITIDTTPYGGKPIALRTYARNRDGVLTEIDRRTLVRARP